MTEVAAPQPELDAAAKTADAPPSPSESPEAARSRRIDEFVARVEEGLAAVANNLRSRLEDNHATMTQIFRKYDTDRSGTISQAELGPLLQDLLGWDEADPEDMDLLKDFLAMNDMDRDGQIDYQEFLKFMLSGEQSSWAAGVKECFEKMDTDGNGYVDEAEMSAALKDQGLTSKEIKACMKSLDKNKDGKLSYREFKHAAQLGNMGPQGAMVLLIREAMTATAPLGASGVGKPAPDRAWSRLAFDKQAMVNAVFKKFDKDGSGTIDASEVSRMLRVMGLNASSGDALNYLRECDLSHTGQLRLKDFALLLQLAESRRDVKKEQQMVETALKAFDVNGDGKIEQWELKEVLMRKVSDDALTEREADKIIQKFKPDLSGKIDLHDLAMFLLGR
ncbi:unnamed protein product [Pedinophyceae sp. YPF-701]|nr:unnamed protein product [Pedinophyceae sp. YPF-701]